MDFSPSQHDNQIDKINFQVTDGPYNRKGNRGVNTMKIIISPAKTMSQPDTGNPIFDFEMDCPAFQQEAERLIRSLKEIPPENLKALFKTMEGCLINSSALLSLFLTTINCACPRYP